MTEKKETPHARKIEGFSYMLASVPRTQASISLSLEGVLE